MSYYAIKRGKRFFDGREWQARPRAFRHDQLPDEIPINNTCKARVLKRSDLRYRDSEGAIGAEALPTLVGLDDDRIDYGKAES